jgi:hypothetical protein
MAERRRWVAFIVWLAWVVVYACMLASALWFFSSINRSPQNPLMAYIVFFPPEMTLVATIASAFTTYFNALALHWIGARLVWNIPSSHPPRAKSPGPSFSSPRDATA